MDSGNPVFLWLVLLTTVAVIVLVVCWIILPFAVIGTKPLLRQILAEHQRTNDLLNRLDAHEQLRRINERQATLN
jgi:hypothetical protein